MTTPTDLPARVQEALRLNKRLSDALTAASVANSPEQTHATQERVRAAEEACRRPNHELVPALAADWQRLRERERVLTEALQKIAGLDPTRAAVNMAATQAVSIARAALSPEPKT